MAIFLVQMVVVMIMLMHTLRNGSVSYIGLSVLHKVTSALA